MLRHRLHRPEGHGRLPQGRGEHPPDGFDGKSIINPRQIPIVHEIFTPTQKDIIFAEKVVKEIDSKKALGIGVFTVDGKMIDIAFYDGAKRTIDLAKASGVYKGDL